MLNQQRNEAEGHVNSVILSRSDQIRSGQDMDFTLERASPETVITGHTTKTFDRDMLKEQAETDAMKTKNPRAAAYGGLLEDDAVDNG